MMRVKTRSKSERGQALVLLALVFIGLIGFTGLAIDAGVMYSYIGHLRKSVDTAALSATNQYRRGMSETQITDSAKEFILLNMPGIDTGVDVVVQTCQSSPLPGFCDIGAGERKKVRVEAEARVPLAFLSVLGFEEVTIRADAISEAASIDLILVIDNSPSMAYDGGTDPLTCNSDDSCQPFQTVKDSAIDFAEKMFYPYDRVGVVTFAQYALQELSLTTCELGDPTSSQDCVTDAIGALEVALPLTECPFAGPYGCTTTNTAGGLVQAHRMLRDQARPDAVWVVVLLSDGVANAAHDMGEEIFTGTYPPASAGDIGWWCPKNEDISPPVDTWTELPSCQDGLAAEVHTPGEVEYFDADDAARYIGTVVGCLNQSGVTGCPANGGDEAIIFTIGLGQSVVNYNPEAEPSPGWDVNVGEQMLRFVANVGYDGLPASGADDPCNGYASEAQCGNYYYAADAADLDSIFSSIADRILNRLTH